MKVIKKILKGLLIFILVITLAVIGLDAAWILVPEARASKKIDDLEQYAVEVENLSINENAKIIGLGEATHGNVEFQELKLEVLQELVEKYDVRSFSLETDFGCGLKINDFIHAGNDVNREEANSLEFHIYHTQQMTDLILWMHDYNQTVPENEQLSFYGFDMQNPTITIEYIANFCKETNIVDEKTIEDILILADNETSYRSEKGQIALNEIEKIYQTMLDKKDIICNRKDYESILRGVECVLMTKEYIAIPDEDYWGGSNYRDECMAKNVAWILKHEEKLGHKRILIAGHNGHIGYQASYYKTMGSNIKDEFGEEYFTIGTDYYKTNVNSSTAGGERGNYSFCSADPLAKKAKQFGGRYYLNFQEVSQGQTYQLINNAMNTGSVGEGCTWVMKYMPFSYRINFAPSSIYDSMIFVYKTTPIEILNS